MVQNSIRFIQIGYHKPYLSVEANQHQVNAAEWGNLYVLNHPIAGLCAAHKYSAMYLWCKLLQQCEITLNLLCTSRCSPKTSTYAILECEFNFN